MRNEEYPANKIKFLKLKKFSKAILLMLKKAKINPIVYGSYMIFYYTQNREIKVNDIDFYIKEKDFESIIKTLKKNRIKFKYIPEWHTLQVFQGNLKLEFDSIDFWYRGKRELTRINFNGLIVKALSLSSLRRIYKRAAHTSKDNPEGNLKKFKILSQKIEFA